MEYVSLNTGARMPMEGFGIWDFSLTEDEIRQIGVHQQEDTRLKN